MTKEEDKALYLEEQEKALASINILCTLIKKANPYQIITPMIFGSIFRQIDTTNVEDPNFETDDAFLKFF